MSEWQLIETAPRDGTTILLSDGDGVEACAWAPHLHGDDYPWAFIDNWAELETVDGSLSVHPNAWMLGRVKFWQPLPAAPLPAKEGE